MELKTGPMGHLRVEILPDGIRARLESPLEIYDARGNRHTVPAGFETDFASVPRLFWRLVPPWGPYSRAAVVHDYYYRNGIGSRKDADEAFLSLMERLGVPRWKRRAMFAAVRVFGRSAWKGGKGR